MFGSDNIFNFVPLTLAASGDIAGANIRILRIGFGGVGCVWVTVGTVVVVVGSAGHCDSCRLSSENGSSYGSNRFRGRISDCGINLGELQYGTERNNIVLTSWLISP